MGCVVRFFFLVTFFSVSEVAILLWVAQHTSLLFTIACCVFTGILGGYLVRKQGLQTLVRIQNSINSGKIPADEGIEALLLLIVGVLLCVPGFITDTLGFLIVVPAIRSFIARLMVKELQKAVASGQIHTFHTNRSCNDCNVRSETGDAAVENAEIIEESINQGDNDAEKKQI